MTHNLDELSLYRFSGLLQIEQSVGGMDRKIWKKLLLPS
jgi:hypothetical protein